MPSPSPHNNLADIHQQLVATQRELAAIKMRPRESLRNFEYRVKQHPDKILSLTIAEKVQQQQIEQEAREAEEELKKKSP
jgi:phosphoribosylaminoimidazole carboxylase (NCAIR synthetase)